MSPVFSIITVCFNSSSTIGLALDSVAAQRWPHVQHIVIDGASTDDTLEVVRRHGQRVAVVRSEPDRGIYDAMNKGVALATGDYIAFLNADDLYAHERVLEQVAQAIAAAPADQPLEAVYGDVEFFSAAQPDRVLRRFDSGRFAPQRLGWGWMPAHPGLFLARQIFADAGPFRVDYRIAGDFEFIVRAFGRRVLRSRYLPEVLVRMQMGGASTSGIRSTIRLNREMMRACRENGVPTNWFKLLSRYPAKLLEFLAPSARA